MRTLKPYDAVPFTNRKGHVLNPGDAVIAVTSSRGGANLVHGKYLGTRSLWGRPRVVLEVIRSARRLQNAAGKVYDHSAELKLLPYPAYPYGVRYGTPEYTEAHSKYKAESDRRGEKVTMLREGYEYVDYNYIGYTNLRLNKIYPADIALREVSL